MLLQFPAFFWRGGGGEVQKVHLDHRVKNLKEEKANIVLAHRLK